ARVLARLGTYLEIELPLVPASLVFAPAVLEEREPTNADGSREAPTEDEPDEAEEPTSLTGLAPPLESEPPHAFVTVDEDEDTPEVTAEMDARTLSRLHAQAALRTDDEEQVARLSPEDADADEDEDDPAGDIARRVQRLRSRLAEGR